ncbi:MAG: AAA family ATPase [Candidatus Excrementavichristensenella sp.]
MKSVRLVMSAFGPFAKETVLDFDKLGERGVFLIAGDTGSGKTTIFDAISYALYGEASGGKERRSASSFRSDYAAPEDETYVEYTFLHRGRGYLIRRSPEYQRKSKRGTGMATQPARVYMEDLESGDSWDAQRTVNEKVKELIGLDQDQFARTVMIAQGDFMKILNAGSDERTKLFTHLFNTGRYAELQSRLRQKNSACQQVRDQINQRISLIADGIRRNSDCARGEQLRELAADPERADGLLQCLGEIIPEEEERLRNLRERLDRAGAQRDDINRQILQQEEVNKRFVLKEKLELGLQGLKAQQSAMDERALRLERGRRALTLAGQEERLRINRNSARGKKELIEDLEKTMTDLQTRLPLYADALAAARKNAEEIEPLTLQGRNILDALPAVEDHVRSRKALEKARRDLKGYLAQNEAADAAYDKVRRAYYASQYGLIARELQEGMPCPVCGSPIHPDPAALAEGSASREDVERAEASRRDAYEKLRKADKDVQAYEKDVEKHRERILALGISERESPENVRARADALLQKAKARKARLEKAEDDHRKVERELQSKGEMLEQARKDLEGIESDGVCFGAEFQKSLAGQGFGDEAEYDAAKLSPGEIRRLEDEIRGYGEQKRSLEDQLKAISNELADRVWKDPAPLRREIERLEGEIKALDDGRQKLYSRFRAFVNASADLEQELERRDVNDREWAVVSDVFRTVSGQLSGSAKMTLEVYVQQHYFRKLILAANERLRMLTEGMFTLRCKEEARNMVSQSGLDLDVLDRSTGLWRDVSTLSGGESFMTSLSLALGLSDIVQNEGGIRLDSMFIDEGFGTLDEGALKNAVTMLDSLADGNRMIGVISHVAQLRERIDHRVLVRKKASGSTLTMDIDD